MVREYRERRETQDQIRDFRYVLSQISCFSVVKVSRGAAFKGSIWKTNFNRLQINL